MTTPASAMEIRNSRGFPEWLARHDVSLAFTTYQVGKVFWIGAKSDGRLEIFNRTFNRAMGLCGDAQTLYLSTLYQIWRFENVLEQGRDHDGYDRVYVPQVAWTTGDIDVHDMAVDGDGRLLFVNTLFSCLATTSDRHSFTPAWRPPFVSRLAAEDRCHLNGLAMRAGEPRYVTAVSRSDVADGWRDHRRDGGIVLDVQSDEVLVDGLSMPHSPRWHDGRLWVLDSGTGTFGYVDLERGGLEHVAFCPGYGRGMAFVGDYAVIGLSRPRAGETGYEGLALNERLASRNARPRCGLIVVNLQTGDTEHWLRIDGVIDELYDVVTLPGARRPMAIGLKSDEIRRVIRVGPAE